MAVPQLVHEYRYKYEGSGGVGGIGDRHTAEFGILKPGDLDFDSDHIDLEAQQTCSVSSGTAVTGGGPSSGEGQGTPEDEVMPLQSASLRAPPRAHLRIHVTRSVSVEKYPRSPRLGEEGVAVAEEDLEKQKGAGQSIELETVHADSHDDLARNKEG
ncbi:hypothetical protein MMYC01_208303 [Madurella mycetomatis]|uniref:Uncharacterized protein n=1 Tax=Madurella mycetomatis TaxID=100816 RepID=A0A175VVX6_9PEZI|nr:hypothetical protein MMYC01_208303 [Madurella mycetomatis]